MKVIKDLIDFQYTQYTISSFALQFKVFLLFYILPLITLVFTRNREIVYACAFSCMSVQVIVFLFELIQIKYYGLNEYLKDAWNRIDQAMFFLNIIFLITRVQVEENEPMS